MALQRTLQGIVADLSAGGSVGVASFTWMAPVADVLQIGATIVAIVAGVYAIRWHKLRIQIAKEKRDVTS